MIKLEKLLETFSFNLQDTLDNLNSFHMFEICTNSRKDNNMQLSYDSREDSNL